jgi:hypothetical protein
MRVAHALATVAALMITRPALALAEVRVVAPPNEGAVPDAEVDRQGAVHLVYVSRGSVQYVRSEDGGRTFSSPLQVNSEPGTVPPPNMFRGPDVAVGREGIVHVVWYKNAYQRNLPKEEWGVQYARKLSAAGAFEPTRNLNHRPSDNYSLAADGRGDVAVLWMARGLFLSASRNDGRAFSDPVRVAGPDTCECCASRAVLGPDGRLFGLYRDKTNNDRDMYLATLDLDGSLTAREKLSAVPWHIEACPMTGAFLSRVSDSALVGAWEREGQIYFGRMDRGGKLQPPGELATPRMDYLRKFPVALPLADGSTLVAWKHGRSLEWQAYDRRGRPVGGVSGHDSASLHRPAGVVTRDGDALLFP